MPLFIFFSPVFTISAQLCLISRQADALNFLCASGRLSVSVICRRTRDVTMETEAELVPGALGEGPLWVWLRATIKASALAYFTLTFPGLPPFSNVRPHQLLLKQVRTHSPLRIPEGPGFRCCQWCSCPPSPPRGFPCSSGFLPQVQTDAHLPD